MDTLPAELLALVSIRLDDRSFGRFVRAASWTGAGVSPAEYERRRFGPVHPWRAVGAGDVEALAWWESHRAAQVTAAFGRVPETTHRVLEHGASVGVVRWLDERGYVRLGPGALPRAVGRGDVALARYLLDEKRLGDIHEDSLRLAQVGGHWPMLRFLHERYVCACTSDTVIAAVRQGNLEAVEWLFAAEHLGDGPVDLQRWTDAVKGAAMTHGQRGALAWWRRRAGADCCDRLGGWEVGAQMSAGSLPMLQESVARSVACPAHRFRWEWVARALPGVVNGEAPSTVAWALGQCAEHGHRIGRDLLLRSVRQVGGFLPETFPLPAASDQAATLELLLAHAHREHGAGCTSSETAALAASVASEAARLRDVSSCLPTLEVILRYDGPLALASGFARRLDECAAPLAEHVCSMICGALRRAASEEDSDSSDDDDDDAARDEALEVVRCDRRDVSVAAAKADCRTLVRALGVAGVLDREALATTRWAPRLHRWLKEHAVPRVCAPCSAAFGARLRRPPSPAPQGPWPPRPWPPGPWRHLWRGGVEPFGGGVEPFSGSLSRHFAAVDDPAAWSL